MTGLALLVTSKFSLADNLSKGFASPPDSAKPWVYWYELGGKASKTGITRDLEAMKEQGIGGAMWFSIGGFRSGPYDFGSPGYLDFVDYIISEADRTGIKLCIANCDGWSEAGGPWIKPEQAMKVITWSKMEVVGPAKFSSPLPKPSTVADYYKDIAVLAYPSTRPNFDTAFKHASPKVFFTSSKQSAGNLIDDTLMSQSIVSGGDGVVIEFPEPFNASMLSILKGFEPINGLDIEASSDGKAFWLLKHVNLDASWNSKPSPIPFPETTAKYFRIKFKDVSSYASIRKIELLRQDENPRYGSDIAQFVNKAAYIYQYTAFTPTGDVPADRTVSSDKMLNLTSRLTADGRIEWDVPAGRWTIARVGYTLSDEKNHPACPTGVGWECDKLRSDAVDTQFNGFIGKLTPKAGKSFIMTHADSWEVGCQNWTRGFETEFKQRRGYDITPWLPALTGEVVQSGPLTDRFLWDYRRTIVELLAEKFYGRFRELSKRNGILFEAENGDCTATFNDPIENAANIDVPMGEMVTEGGEQVKSPADSQWLTTKSISGAHVTGKKIISCEAFTTPGDDYRKGPFAYKPYSDKYFAYGVNHMVLHVYAHQADEDYPGDQLTGWGGEIKRKNTWWKQSHAWFSYLTRCQYMLQQGYCATDVCVLYGENDGATVGSSESIAPGFKYDWVNGKTLIERMKIRNGKLHSIYGNDYSLLVLPATPFMTPQLAHRIEELVKEGAVVLGPKPIGSPSLSGYPNCDKEVREIGDRVWGNCDGLGVREHAYGKGLVLYGLDTTQALERAKVAKDFAYQSSASDMPLYYSHRIIGKTDAYFVSNQSDKAGEFSCTFRVTGKSPELWDPNTGKTTKLAVYNVENGMTTLSLKLDPFGSTFVVFKEPTDGPSVKQVKFEGPTPARQPELTVDKSGRTVMRAWQSGTYRIDSKSVNVSSIPAPVVLDGHWTVSFDPKWGGPAKVEFPKLMSWTDSTDDGIKYYSGTAVYTREFDVSADMLSSGQHVFLDLGEVSQVAEVSVNAKRFGVLWKPAYEVEVTDALRIGRNSISISVTNTWANRLIGDASLPKRKRLTTTNSVVYKGGEPLVKSGLLGPVRLICAKDTVGL